MTTILFRFTVDTQSNQPNQVMSKPTTIFVLSVALLLSTVETSKAETVFSEGLFGPGDITMLPFFLRGTATSSQVSAGGNPGEYLSVSIIGNAPDSSTFAAFLVDGATYNPATQGAVERIDYREDNRYLSSSVPARFVFTAPALMQGGQVFAGANLNVSYKRTNESSSWVTSEFDNLTEDNFFLVVDGGFGTAQPDFSESGAEIQFGFIRAQSAGGAPQYTITTGIDNWSLTVNPSAVPEPSVLVPLLLGACGCVSVRRRRR